MFELNEKELKMVSGACEGSECSCGPSEEPTTPPNENGEYRR
ncbi:hypothetical protein [Enterovibrio coralii]|nr:hypothetical protein [Enterovibrio coralii]